MSQEIAQQLRDLADEIEAEDEEEDHNPLEDEAFFYGTCGDEIDGDNRILFASCISYGQMRKIRESDWQIESVNTDGQGNPTAILEREDGHE